MCTFIWKAWPVIEKELDHGLDHYYVYIFTEKFHIQHNEHTTHT